MIDTYGYSEAPYEERLVERNLFDWGFISTAAIDGGKTLFETAIVHPDYNNRIEVIIAGYDTKKDAIKGHKHWKDVMKNPPDLLTDIANSKLQSVADKKTFKKETSK